MEEERRMERKKEEEWKRGKGEEGRRENAMGGEGGEVWLIDFH